MRNGESLKLARRVFLKGVAAITGTGPLMPELMTGVATASTVAAVEGRAQPLGEAAPGVERSPRDLRYESLGPDEVEFVEAMVNVMCPGGQPRNGRYSCRQVVHRS
jgi:hypothetical protein